MVVPFHKGLKILQQEGPEEFVKKTSAFITNSPSFFRLRSTLNSYRYHNYATIDPNRTICVNPLDVYVQISNDLPIFDPTIFNGTVARGEWDRGPMDPLQKLEITKLYPENELPSSKILNHHFSHISVSNFSRRSIGHLLNIDEYKAVKEYPPTVNIARSGEFQLNTGLFQFWLAYLLEINSLPVRVCVRYHRWQQFRDQIKYYHMEYLRERSYNQLPHPDLQQFDAEHNSEQRFALIQKGLEKRCGTVLDIGSHMDGYFCHKFENMGFECYAVESNKRHCYFLRKFREINGMEFDIINGDILEAPEDVLEKSYDICLSLNIFHHFLKTEQRFTGLCNLLRQLDAEVMFFQSHTDDYVDSWKNRGNRWFKTFVEDEFAEFILNHSQYTSYKFLGRPEEDNRPIYKLTK